MYNLNAEWTIRSRLFAVTPYFNFRVIRQLYDAHLPGHRRRGLFLPTLPCPEGTKEVLNACC